MATKKQEEKKKNGSIPANVFPSEKAREQIGVAAVRKKMAFGDMLDEIIDRVGTTPRLLKEIIEEI